MLSSGLETKDEMRRRIKMFYLLYVFSWDSRKLYKILILISGNLFCLTVFAFPEKDVCNYVVILQ